MSCNASHFKGFGCVSYAHVPKKIRGKLDDKSEKCVFISYSEQSKAYKLYNPVTKKTIISRDVVFKEQESWNGTIEKKINPQAPLMEEDDVAEKEQHESKEQTPARNPRFSEQHGSSSRSTDHNSPSNQPGDESSNGKKNTRSLKDIYDDLDVS